MAAPRLTDSQRKLLEWLNDTDPATGESRSEFQFNLWAIPSEVLAPHDVPRLQKRELIGSEGRGNYRQIYITNKGKEALAG